MNDEQMQKWVTALRSGGYKQGKTYLKQKIKKTGVNTFCCLGVLCDIENNGKWVWDKKNKIAGFYGQNAVCGLPNEMQYKYGITHFGYFNKLNQTKFLTIGNGEYPSLTLANDGGASFLEIANCIEKNYKLL